MRFLFVSKFGKTTFLHMMQREYFQSLPSEQVELHLFRINCLEKYNQAYFRTEFAEFCSTCCTLPAGKRKMVLIDGIDFVPLENQQLLLSILLNHRPDSIHFLLTCQDIRRVSERIRSFAQILSPDWDERVFLTDIARGVLANEQIAIQADQQEAVFSFLLRSSNFHPKRMLLHLEKWKLFGQPIDLPAAERLCTQIQPSVFEKCTRFLQQHQAKEAYDLLLRLIHQGYSCFDIFINYFQFLKNLEDEDIGEERMVHLLLAQLTDCVQKFYEIREHPIELFFFVCSVVDVFQKEKSKWKEMNEI